MRFPDYFTLGVTIIAMRPICLLAAPLLITLALGTGCSTSPSLAMKIEAPSTQPRVLLGQFTGSVALLQGNTKNAEVSATDGTLTCSGQSTTGQFSTDMRMNRIAHNFTLTCSNGTTGQMILNINASVSTINGIGVGTLSDGSKIKVVVGDLSGTFNW